MQGALQAVQNGDVFVLGGVGVGLCVVLILTARIVMEAGQRQPLRAPVGLLIAHLVLIVPRAFVDADTVIHQSLGALAALTLFLSIGRIGFLLVVDVLLGRRLTRPLPKIFRDILSALVYVAVAFPALRAAGVDPASLLTTSALLTAVIGLSLQDTLGNLFAGLAIQAQNPFDVGDWIRFDDDADHIGRVTEINWRATKVLTLDKVELTIPNSPLARATLHNFTRPDAVARRSIRFIVPFDVAPHRVQDTVNGVMHDADGVLKSHASDVVVSGFSDRGLECWVRFYIREFHRRETIDALVRERIWYALTREGIPFAVPAGHFHLRRIDKQVEAEETRDRRAERIAALETVDIIAALPRSAIEQLADAAEHRQYGRGEIIARQGVVGEVLFVLVDGQVLVTHKGNVSSTQQLAVLGPGSIFGEVSVVTGQPRRATVRAKTPTEVVAVGKAAFKAVLEQSPALAERVSEVLAQREEQLQILTEQSPTAVPDTDADQSKVLLSRIREFFSL